MKAQTVRIQFETYAYPRERRPFDVRAYVVGDLAVHRWAMWGAHDKPLMLGQGWTISHVPTGLGIGSAFRRRKLPSTRAPMLAIAEAWQAECPDYFTVLRNAGPSLNIPPSVAVQAREVLDRLIETHLEGQGHERSK